MTARYTPARLAPDASTWMDSLTHAVQPRVWPPGFAEFACRACVLEVEVAADVATPLTCLDCLARLARRGPVTW